jgi:hypothetical protein
LVALTITAGDAQRTLDDLNFKLKLKTDGDHETIFVFTKGQRKARLIGSSSIDFQDYFVDKNLLCIASRSKAPFHHGYYKYSLSFYAFDPESNIWEFTHDWGSEDEYLLGKATFEADYILSITPEINVAASRCLPARFQEKSVLHISPDLSYVENRSQGTNTMITNWTQTYKIKNGKVIRD